MQTTSKIRKATSFRGWGDATETEDEAGKDPDGGNAKSGPGAAITSGFGGLGLDGIVGSDDWVGERGTRRGEGNNGVISGDRVGEDDDRGLSGAPGNNAGAADMVENFSYSTWWFVSEANEEWKTMKTMKNIEQKGAINDDNINSLMRGNFNKCVFLREKENEKEGRRSEYGKELWGGWWSRLKKGVTKKKLESGDWVLTHKCGKRQLGSCIYFDNTALHTVPSPKKKKKAFYCAKGQDWFMVFLSVAHEDEVSVFLLSFLSMEPVNRSV